MEERAEVIIHQSRMDPTGLMVFCLEWQGKINWPVEVSDEFEEEFLSMAPWPLVLVERLAFTRLYMRTDTIFPFWVFWKFRDRLKNRGLLIKARVLATLQVWHLAYRQPWDRPSWKDILKRDPTWD